MDMQKKLTKDDILNSSDSDLKEVEIKEWGGFVYIGTMTLRQRLDFDAKHCAADGSFKDLKDPSLVYDMLQVCLRDVKGDYLFSNDDIKELGRKNAKVIHNLFYEALGCNYLTKESAELIKKKSQVAQ